MNEQMVSLPDEHSMHIPLRLEPAPPHRHATDICGLFINDPRPESWAEVAERIQGAAGDTASMNVAAARFLVIPGRGALYYVAAEIDGSGSPRSLGRLMSSLPGHINVFPYQQLADRLFIPVDAQLFPSLSLKELQSQFGLDAFLWHPIDGLFGFERPMIASILDLFQSPQPSEHRFFLTPETQYENRTLRSIELIVPPDLSFLEIPGMEGVSDDIGNKSLKQIKLPGDNSLSQALRQVTGLGLGVTGLGLAVLSQLFSRGKRDGPVDGTEPGNQGKSVGSGDGSGVGSGTGGALGAGLLGFLSKGMAGLAGMAAGAVNQLQRSREVDRLLDLLKNNPEEGLRHAIPMGGSQGGNMSRGSGFGGNRLTRGLLNFNLGGLSGGGPVDHWDMKWEQQEKLRQHYRDQATKASAEGRHRRAAYIYAHLLGDLSAAAGALAAGGMHREAAVIYQKKLHQPEQAARCLAAGGLFQEAVDLYQELELWLKAADVLEKAGRTEEARQMVRKQVAIYKARPDLLAAAELLEERLKEIDEAVLLLEDGWRESGHVHFLKAGIDMHARHQRYHQTDHLLDEIESGLALPTTSLNRHPSSAATLDLKRPQLIKLGDLLSDMASTYPKRKTRQRTHELLYRLCGAYVNQLPQYERGQFLQYVARLAPDDKLLKRDVREQLTRGLKPNVKTVEQVSGKGQTAEVTFLPIICNPFEGEVALKSVGGAAVMMYREDQRLKLLYLVLSYKFEYQRNGVEMIKYAGSWPWTVPQMPQLMVGDKTGDKIYLRTHGGMPSVQLKSQNLLAKQGGNFWVHVTRRWESFGGLSEDAPGEIWGIEGDKLAQFNRDGVEGASVHIPWELLVRSGVDPDRVDIDDYHFLHARRDRIILGVYDQVWRYKRKTESWEMIGEVPEPIERFAYVAKFARPRYAASHPKGVTVIWDNLGNQQQHIAGDMVSPHICFTRHSGLLVVADGHEVRLYATSKGEAILIHQSNLRGVNGLKETDLPIHEVIPIGVGDDFLVLREDGELVYGATAKPTGKAY